MNMRALECFVAVVDEGSFTRAARRIGISQPSLSQHIRALEAELDGPVFSRLPRGVALTPAGRTLLPEARIAVRAVERRLRGGRAARDRRLGGVRARGTGAGRARRTPKRAPRRIARPRVGALPPGSRP